MPGFYLCARLALGLEQEFSILGKFLESLHDILTEVQTKIDELLRLVKYLNEDEEMRRHVEIQNLYQNAETICVQKFSKMERIYGLVDLEIRRLDADAAQFRRASALVEMRTSRKKMHSLLLVQFLFRFCTMSFLEVRECVCECLFLNQAFAKCFTSNLCFYREINAAFMSWIQPSFESLKNLLCCSSSIMILVFRWYWNLP